jgi:diacylglycerol O-acyltransferase
MAERLSALDGAFLRLETERAPMHVGWRALFEPPASRTRPTLETVRALVAARVALVPRCRQRLAFPAFGIGEPAWVDDHGFNAADHVVALSAEHEALSLDAFDVRSDRFFSAPLDRGCPLWQIGLAPRLEDGRIGVVGKVHHAMADGIAATEIALLLFDSSPTTEPGDAPAWCPAPAPTSTRLALEALVDAAGAPLQLARALGRTPRRTMAGVVPTVGRAALSLREDVLRPTSRAFLNPSTATRRTLIGHPVALELLRNAKPDPGVTTNDVCLAAVAGALRHLAIGSGEQPRALKAMIPVNIRDGENLGNRISLAFIKLPVDASTALERLALVHERTRAFKDAGRPAGMHTLLRAAELLPIPLRTPLARAAGSPRLFNLTVSNIPGPKVPVYLLGAELTTVYPIVPMLAQHALSIGIFTHREHAHFGLYADRAALPGVGDLPRLLDREIAMLAGRSSPQTQSGRARRRRPPGERAAESARLTIGSPCA